MALIQKAPDSCPICFTEDIELIEVGCCMHKACFACLETWYQTNSSDEDILCFTCRSILDPSLLIEVGLNAIVEKNETENTSTTDDDGADCIDELTRDWLYSQRAKECKRCGMWITKNGGCNHMECLCGYEFCWYCLKAWDEECSCDEEDYEDEEELRRRDEAFEALSFIFAEATDVAEDGIA